MIESHLGFHDYARFLIELKPAFPWCMSFYGKGTTWFKSVCTTPLSMVQHQVFHDSDPAWFVCDILLDPTESYPRVHSLHTVKHNSSYVTETHMGFTATGFSACQIFILFGIGVLLKVVPW